MKSTSRVISKRTRLSILRARFETIYPLPFSGSFSKTSNYVSSTSSLTPSTSLSHKTKKNNSNSNSLSLSLPQTSNLFFSLPNFFQFGNFSTFQRFINFFIIYTNWYVVSQSIGSKESGRDIGRREREREGVRGEYMDERVLTVVSNLLGFLTLALVIALHLSSSKRKAKKKVWNERFVGRRVEEVDR